MSRAKKLIIFGLVIIEVLIFLLPTTLLYFFGILIAMGTFGAHKDTMPMFFEIAAFLLIPGYGLFSLWWLVFKFKDISIIEIPKLIWGGLLTGCLIALLFLAPFAMLGFSPPTQFISYKHNFVTMLIFGGGPFIIVLTLLSFIYLRNKAQALVAAGQCRKF